MTNIIPRSLLSVLSASTLSSPQLILHQGTQTFKTPNLIHVSPLLKTLYWLPDTLRGKTWKDVEGPTWQGLWACLQPHLCLSLWLVKLYLRCGDLSVFWIGQDFWCHRPFARVHPTPWNAPARAFASLPLDFSHSIASSRKYFPTLIPSLPPRLDEIPLSMLFRVSRAFLS